MKRINCIIFLFILISSVYSYNSIENEAKIIFEDGIQWYKNNDFDKALDSFQIIIKEYNDTVYSKQCYFYIGDIYNMLSDNYEKDSLENFSKAGLLYKNTDIAKKSYFKIASIHKKNNNIKELERIYYTIINNFSPDFEVEEYYFRLLELLKDQTEKIEIIKKYLENYQYSVRAKEMTNKLFDLYIKNNDIRQAQYLLESNDEDDFPWNLRLDFYSAQQNYTKALNIIEEYAPEDLSLKLKYYKKSYDMHNIIKTYQEMLEKDKNISFWDKIEYTDLLLSYGNNEKAIDIVKDMQNNTENNMQKNLLRLKEADIIFSEKVYFPSEDGANYIKDSQNIRKAESIYEEIADENDDISSPKAILKIVEIQKEHLYNWDKLKEYSRLLIDDYPNTFEAERAKKIMDSYNFDY